VNSPVLALALALAQDCSHFYDRLTKSNELAYRDQGIEKNIWLLLSMLIASWDIGSKLSCFEGI
jgi:hypothetical protein